MSRITVPDPEPEWERAFEYQGGKRNPAQQYFMFEQAMAGFRWIAGLKVSAEDVARRLRLLLEPGETDGLGPVDAAFFTLGRVGFAVHADQNGGFAIISVLREHDVKPIDALDILLEALGIDWRAVATVAHGEGRDRVFLEPTLDSDLRPTFPQATEAERPGSGT